MPRLREYSGAPIEPATSRGTLTAQVTLGLAIDPDMPKGSVNYNVVADIANFSVDHFMMAQRIEAQTLRVTANPQGYQARGDVRIGGMPAMVDYRKPRAASSKVACRRSSASPSPRRSPPAPCTWRCRETTGRRRGRRRGRQCR